MVFTWSTNCTFHCIFNQSHCEWVLSIVGLSFQFKLNSVDDKNLKASIFHRFIGPSGFWTQPLLIGSRSLSTVQSSVLETGTGILGNYFHFLILGMRHFHFHIGHFQYKIGTHGGVKLGWKGHFLNIDQMSMLCVFCCFHVLRGHIIIEL